MRDCGSSSNILQEVPGVRIGSEQVQTDSYASEATESQTLQSKTEVCQEGFETADAKNEIVAAQAATLIESQLGLKEAGVPATQLFRTSEIIDTVEVEDASVVQESSRTADGQHAHDTTATQSAQDEDDTEWILLQEQELARKENYENQVRAQEELGPKLALLRDLGVADEEAMISVLLAAGGDVSAAAEILISQS